MDCCVVFAAIFCFVSMVTGTRVTHPIPQKYEQCLTNQQCAGKGTSQSVVLDQTTYCCKGSQRLSITTGWDKLLMRLSQSLGRMLYTTLLQKTAPDLARIHSDSKHSKSADSSKSDSSGSFSDSESLEKRSNSDSMESRSIPGSDDSLEYVDSRSIPESVDSLEYVDSRSIPESVDSLEYVDSRSIPESVDSLEYVDSRSIPESVDSLADVARRTIVEYLDCSNGCGNEARIINRRRLSDEPETRVRLSANAGGVSVGTQAEMGCKESREATFKDSISSNTDEKRTDVKTIQKSPTLIKTTREDLNMEKWIRGYFGTELNIGKNQKVVPYNLTAILIYLLNRRYIEHNDKPTRQDTDGLSPENIIEKDEGEIPNAISSDMQKRDEEFDYENENMGSQNRDHDKPRDEIASATFTRQQSLNAIAIRDKRHKNKNPNPEPPNKGHKNAGTGTNNNQATIKGGDTKSNLTNTTKAGVPQAGPASGAKGQQKYIMCRCLPGN